MAKDDIITFVNKYWHVISLAIALAMFFIHLHGDVKYMERVQSQHEEAIKEMQANQTKTWIMMARQQNGRSR